MCVCVCKEGEVLCNEDEEKIKFMCVVFASLYPKLNCLFYFFLFLVGYMFEFCIIWFFLKLKEFYGFEFLFILFFFLLWFCFSIEVTRFTCGCLFFFFCVPVIYFNSAYYIGKCLRLFNSFSFLNTVVELFFFIIRSCY